jgi:hypothetical protein
VGNQARARRTDEAVGNCSHNRVAVAPLVSCGYPVPPAKPRHRPPPRPGGNVHMQMGMARVRRARMDGRRGEAAVVAAVLAFAAS